MGNWDSKVELDPTFWMAEGFNTDQEFWDSGERDFKEIVSGLSQAWLKQAAVLEVGCGVGRILKAAKKSVKRLVGVDVSSAAIHKAKEYLQDESVTLQTISGERINNLSEKFDLIYSYGTLVHLAPQTLVKYLFDINHLLEDNGRATLQLYVGQEVLFALNDTFSLRSYERHRLESTCKQLGFDILSIEPCQLPYDAVDRILGREPVLVCLVKVSSSKALDETYTSHLVSRIEPDFDPIGSRDEFQMAITKAKRLIDQGRFVEAEKFFSYALKVYKNVDPDTLLAYDILKKHLE
jgi:SAM-dependent methyltransferase